MSKQNDSRLHISALNCNTCLELWKEFRVTKFYWNVKQVRKQLVSSVNKLSCEQYFSRIFCSLLLFSNFGRPPQQGVYSSSALDNSVMDPSALESFLATHLRCLNRSGRRQVRLNRVHQYSHHFDRRQIVNEDLSCHFVCEGPKPCIYFSLFRIQAVGHWKRGILHVRNDRTGVLEWAFVINYFLIIRNHFRRPICW